MVVVHRGSVVAERYGTQPATVFGPAEEIDADSTLASWSMAKSITHAAVGVLVAEDRIDLDAPAPVAQWWDTPKAEIRIIDLLEMRPGLEFVEDYVDGETSNCLAMLFGEGAADHAGYAARFIPDRPTASRCSRACWFAKPDLPRHSRQKISTPSPAGSTARRIGVAGLHAHGDRPEI